MMKSKLILSAFFALLFCLNVSAQTTPATYKAVNGAHPWSDRSYYSLDAVPAHLLSEKPLPQQSCASRSLVLPEKLKAITFGVCEMDLKAFQKAYPVATLTADDFKIVSTVSNPVPYKIFTMSNPGPLIKADFKAGLILLKMED
jgi:hypothetical protein